jgi:hypothetical protein
VALHGEAIKLGFNAVFSAEQLANLTRELDEGRAACEASTGTKQKGKKTPPQFPKMAILAREADEHWGKTEEAFRYPKYSLQGMYPTVYRNFSSFVHGGATSIRTLISRGPTTGTLCVGEEMGAGFSNAFTIAPIIFGMGLLAASHALGFPSADAVNGALRNGRDELVDEFASETTIPAQGDPE